MGSSSDLADALAAYLAESPDVAPVIEGRIMQ